MYSNIDQLPLGKVLQVKQDSGKKPKKAGKKKTAIGSLISKGYK